MTNLVRIAAVILLLVALVAGWQIGAAYVENYQFSSDLRDLAVDNNARTGLEAVKTEDELKSAVTASAQQHGIRLAPDRLTVRRTLTPATVASNGTIETPSNLDISIATDYDAPVHVLVFSFNIHFAPASSHSAPMLLK